MDEKPPCFVCANYLNLSGKRNSDKGQMLLCFSLLPFHVAFPPCALTPVNDNLYEIIIYARHDFWLLLLLRCSTNPAKLCYYSSSKIIRLTDVMSNYFRINREKQKQQKELEKPTNKTWNFDLEDQHFGWWRDNSFCQKSFCFKLIWKVLKCISTFHNSTTKVPIIFF